MHKPCSRQRVRACASSGCVCRWQWGSHLAGRVVSFSRVGLSHRTLDAFPAPIIMMMHSRLILQQKLSDYQHRQQQHLIAPGLTLSIPSCSAVKKTISVWWKKGFWRGQWTYFLNFFFSPPQEPFQTYVKLTYMSETATTSLANGATCCVGFSHFSDDFASIFLLAFQQKNVFVSRFDPYLILQS